MLFWQLDLAAASRTFCTAGKSRPIRIAMIAITTSSSISVNADRRIKRVAIDPSPDNVTVEDEAGPVSPSALGRTGEADRTEDGHTPPSREGRSAARMTKELGAGCGLATA